MEPNESKTNSDIANPDPQSNGPKIKSDTVSPDAQLKYASETFQYHAVQRTQCFYFFMLVIGGLVTAYKSFDTPVAQFALALAGIFASIAFTFLDLRNAELVNFARKALRDIEDKLTIKVRSLEMPDGYERPNLYSELGFYTRFLMGDGKPWRAFFLRRVSYRYWFKTIYLVAALTFAFFAVRILAIRFEWPSSVSAVVISLLLLAFLADALIDIGRQSKPT